MKTDPVPPFGPRYNVNGLEEWRRAARDGLHTMDKFHVRQYADAVEAKIKTMQAAKLREACSVAVDPIPNCASGTRHTTGAAIHEAVKQQHTAALYAYVAKVRRERTPQQWQSLYDEAMIAKRKRERTE